MTIPTYSRRTLLVWSAGGAVASLVTLSGCDRSGQLRDVVLYVTLTLGNPFYSEMISGINSALARQPKWKLDARAGRDTDDASGQKEILESLLTAHNQKSGIRLVGALLVPANSGLDLTQTIKRYNDAKVPIVNLDIPIEPTALSQAGAKVDAFIGSNNREGGKKAAEVMVQQVPEGGRVLILAGASGSANARDRRDGFKEELLRQGSERKVHYEITEWTANWKMAEALTATDSLLASGEPVRGIFAGNDLMALGAAQAVQSARLGNKPKPVIIGYDAIPDAVAAIKEGRMFASISQNPSEMGTRGVAALATLRSGDAVEARQIVPVSVVTKRSN